MGLHFIAVFEAFKGLFVLAAGLGLLHFLKHNVAHVGRILMMHIGVDPNHGYPHSLILQLEHVNDKNIVIIAVLATCYAIVRFIEAYGLWKQRGWAEWLAIFSGAVYLPFEFIEIHKHYSHLKLAFTVGNIVVVGYLLVLRIIESREKSKTQP